MGKLLTVDVLIRLAAAVCALVPPSGNLQGLAHCTLMDRCRDNGKCWIQALWSPGSRETSDPHTLRPPPLTDGNQHFLSYIDAHEQPPAWGSPLH